MKYDLGRHDPVQHRERLATALYRMLGNPKAQMPFVVLEHQPSECFVQFCGSSTEPLRFDVPALKLSEVVGAYAGRELVDDAVERAFRTLGELVAGTAGGSGDVSAALSSGVLTITENPSPEEAALAS